MKIVIMVVRNYKIKKPPKLPKITRNEVGNALTGVVGTIMVAQLNSVVGMKIMSANAIPVVTTDGPISGPFRAALLPIIYDIGTTVFIATSAFSFYSVIRRDVKKGIDGLKWASIGFIGLRFTEVFVNIINKAADDALSRSISGK